MDILFRLFQSKTSRYLTLIHASINDAKLRKQADTHRNFMTKNQQDVAILNWKKSFVIPISEILKLTCYNDSFLEFNLSPIKYFLFLIIIIIIIITKSVKKHFR